MGGQFGKDPYFNPKRARAILTGVLLMHVGLIAVPLIYSSLTDFLEPPLIVMKVGLADLPPGDSPDAGAVAADVPAPKSSEPEPMDELPLDPQKPADLPPDLPPPPPKVETPPTPKVDTPPTPKIETPPPKTETKTNVKPPPKTQTKQDPPKTQTKQDPPKSNLLKPEDIIKPKNTKTQAQIEAERRAREAAEARAKADAKARQDAIAAIRDAAKSGTYGTTNPGQQGILATKEMRDYYEQLNAYIRPKWNAVSPSSVELSGKVANWPTIHLTIEKDGRITKAVIVSKSGNKAIDAAVETLLAGLKVAPVPPQAATIPVTLEIR